MQHCDILIAPRWCVPIEPAGIVLSDHAIAVADGRILDLLPLSEARQKYQSSVLIRRPHHALIPGLVNTHTQAAMTLLRGFGGDLPHASWLAERVWPVERRWVSAEMVRDGTELAVAEMLRAGITCFSDQYYFPEIVAETAVDLNIRAMIGTLVMDAPTSWAGDAEECLRKGSDLVHDAYAAHPLISSCYAPHSLGALSESSFTELRVTADQLDVPVQVRLHETQAEIAASVEQTGKRPFARLDELGLVNASLLAVHAVYLTDSEIERCAETRVSIARCPRSNLKLASGIAPISRYRSAGINVGIGTDGAASNDMLDILAEIRLATLLARAQTSNAAIITPADALRMGTLDSARALGLAGSIGSLETGKYADLACIDLTRMNSQPVYDVLSTLVFSTNACQVTDVWVAGKHQLEDGKLNSIKTDELLERSREWRDRIAATQTR